MSVDRLPDGGDDDSERGIENPRSTEPAALPEVPPPLEAPQQKEDLPAPEKPESVENTVQTEDSPEAPDESPEASDKPAQPPEPAAARETAEPRSRQEHAEPALEVPGRQTQRQPLTDESRSRMDTSEGHEAAFDPDPGNLYDNFVEPEAVEPVRPRTQQERAERITD